MRPGSFAWFARHDLVLAARRVRAFFGKASPIKIGLIMAVALALFHTLAWSLAIQLDEDAQGDSRALYPLTAMMFLFVLPWIVSQALTNATRALYSRGDLDIILASPLSPRVVFAARSLSIALESIGSIAIFVLPVANMLAFVLSWRWLAIYPTLLATGLFGTGLGLILTMALFKICGPRRTRVVAQVIATLIGAGFAIGLQAFNIAPKSLRDSLDARFKYSSPNDLFDMDGVWWLPIRAAVGEVQALAVWSLISIGVFVIATLALARIFARGVLATTGAEAKVGVRHRRKFRFSRSVGATLRRKEWRLMTRDPWLASQILLQIIYTMPISVVLWNAMGSEGSIALATMPAIVVVASHVSASLAWLTISSEDAPEFLATAPVSRARIERAKIEAIIAPMFLLFSLPLFCIWYSLPKGGLIAIFYVIVAAVSSALLNIWNPAPGKRGDLLRRHSQSKLVGILEHTLTLFWAVALALTAYKTWWALAPIACALTLLWANYPGTKASKAKKAKKSAASKTNRLQSA